MYTPLTVHELGRGGGVRAADVGTDGVGVCAGLGRLIVVLVGVSVGIGVLDPFALYLMASASAFVLVLMASVLCWCWHVVRLTRWRFVVLTCSCMWSMAPASAPGQVFACPSFDVVGIFDGVGVVLMLACVGPFVLVVDGIGVSVGAGAGVRVFFV
jgi:hypothetical protein